MTKCIKCIRYFLSMHCINQHFIYLLNIEICGGPPPKGRCMGTHPFGIALSQQGLNPIEQVGWIHTVVMGVCLSVYRYNASRLLLCDVVVRLMK